MVQKILFFRDFQAFSGGHLKVWHYFNHVKQSANWQPYIYFTPNSIFNESNPWNQSKENFVKNASEINPSLLFLAGLDWEIFDQNTFHSSIPIINLIQGLRHAHQQDPRYLFLKRKAIRICVSQEVENAILATGQVKGPCFTIPNGLAFDQLPPPLASEQKDIPLCILALKQAPLGIALKEKLNNTFSSIELVTQSLDRKKFLNYINRAQITLFLPEPEEGFYLPALEGMYFQTLVICPDCGGNRSFCHDAYNCFRPLYQLDALIQSISLAQQINLEQKKVMLSNATATAKQYDLAKEQAAFLTILQQANFLWNHPSTTLS